MSGDLVGRGVESGAAAALLETLDAGPLALVIEGEPGIGKTTMWRATVAQATERGARVLTARPAESEAQLAFATLADLLDDVPEAAFDVLPAPQRHALDVALLRAEPGGAGIDARAVSAGTATLLRGLAAEAPLVIAIDDLQWQDLASRDVLAFTARRLGTSPIGFIVSIRPADDPADDATVLGLGEALPTDRFMRVRLGPLSAGALYHLFTAQLGHAFPRATMVRIAEASGGNPFYALEIGRALGEDGGREAGSPMPVPASVRGLAGDRIRRLPATARGELLRVAALARPTSALVDIAKLAPAEAAGLVEIDFDGNVSFTHPLFAAAVYDDASPVERRAVHRYLSGRVMDVEERARHAALAATGPDPIVAVLLGSAAARARARGATAVAAELLELALRLTPAEDVDDRLLREIELGDDLHLAGQPQRAVEVLEAALEDAHDGDSRGEVLSHLGLILRETDQARAVSVCESAIASASSPAILARAHATLALLCETFDGARATDHSAAAAKLFAELGDTASWSLATLGHCWHELLLGHGADDEAFARALEGLAAGPLAGEWWVGLPPVWVLAHDDFAGARDLFVASADRARQEGNESEIGLICAVVALIDCWRGQPGAADADVAAAIELARIGGSSATLADALRVHATIDTLRGRLDRATDTLVREIPGLGIADAGRLTFGTGVVLGLVAHASGDAAGADRLFSRTTAALEGAGILEMPGYMYQGDHVEALLALGDVDRADAIVAALEARARVFARPSTLALAARCRGLVLAVLGDLNGALEAMEVALAHHDRLDYPYELARTLMAKAQVHRRRTEKRLARDSLERAVELLRGAGAEVWAQRAQAELDRLRFRAAPTDLTETELRIAELAAAGHTNREIASSMFVSPKTVEARLASIYGKLGIRSRAELGGWMAGHLAAIAAADRGDPSGAST